MGEKSKDSNQFYYEKTCRFPSPDLMGTKFSCVVVNEMRRAGIDRRDMFNKVFFRSADGKTKADAASIMSFMMFFVEAATSEKCGLLPDGEHGFYLYTRKEEFAVFIDKLIEAIENFNQDSYELLP